ncbi:MAG: DUF2520 domain-containing protein [Flavobacterium sp.]|uniref:Rossmann-like and DUF2520 domain-containing protein n=1 Tax=Flavobacterium sp. TaxID=239 RepID=UPI0012150491|nr:Rossmann-like and DUF2520 domain-containing protein [Flavobacterium sp.]RZJ68292.1 MAG: DUF2520 domain-containing protein [Flavobacterium sp.]
MVKISMIGFGNVAQHLALAFENSDSIELVQIFSRKPQINSQPFSHKIVHDFSDLQSADLYVISISDSAVADVASKFPFEDKLVVHTAGSLSIDVLDSRNRKGVFYPLQTFSKDKEIDFSKVPICVEAQNAKDLQLLKRVAEAISANVYEIDSQQRKSLHVSAVFVSNFANHMYAIGSDICEQHDIPFDILKPLIQETASKIETLSPQKAQTGPAIRRDQNTIDAHLELLSDANQKDIYKLLTQSIQHERKEL